MEMAEHFGNIYFWGVLHDAFAMLGCPVSTMGILLLASFLMFCNCLLVAWLLCGILVVSVMLHIVGRR